MTEILPNLILASFDESYDNDILEKYQVTHILNVASEININYRVGREYEKHGIKDDDDHSDISTIFIDCINFIKKAHENNGIVLVHCWFGACRSVCIILVYLTYILGWNFDNAYAYIKKKRPSMDIYKLYLLQTREYLEKNK
jgi:protein-tyrosine phosphatase